MWQRYEYIITHANISFRIIACTQFSPQLETFILLLLAPCSPKDGYNKPKTVCMAITAHAVQIVRVVSLFPKDDHGCNNCRLYESDVLFQYMTNRYSHHRQHTRFITPDIKKDEADISVRLVLKRYLFIRAEALRMIYLPIPSRHLLAPMPSL